jgi:hypothetical protein
MTQRAPLDRDVDVRVAKLPASAVLRTQRTSDNRLFVKALDGRDDRVVGYSLAYGD